MAAYPDCQERAFQEIKSNLGLDHAPTLHDRSKTPYVMALIEEILRHFPMAALNVPHMTIEDCTYRGYFFPKDTMVITYAKSVHRDEKVKTFYNINTVG